MGGRGASSASSSYGGAPKSQALAVAEQIDPKLTEAYLGVMRQDDMFTKLTPEQAVQNLIDLVVPASYFEGEITKYKKDATSAKRAINSKRTSQRTKDKAQIRLKLAQDQLTIAQFNLEVAKLLGW